MNTAKTAVIVCSNSAIDYIDHPYNIPVFRSVIIFGNETYDDYSEISADEFYSRLKTDKVNFPHTAFMALGRMVGIMENLKQQGYEEALVILISGKMSGLTEGVKLAAEEVENFEVTIFDSLSLGYPQSYMALTACRMFEDGKAMTDVIERLKHIRAHHHLFFSVDTLEYLIRNGRLSKLTGAVAQMLKIRPLLHINKEGIVETLEKTRTTQKARDLMVQTFLEEVKDKRVTVFVIKSNEGSAVVDIKEKLLNARSDFGDIKEYFLTPVVGAHCGPGTIGIGYIEED